MFTCVLMGKCTTLFIFSNYMYTKSGTRVMPIRIELFTGIKMPVSQATISQPLTRNVLFRWKMSPLLIWHN